MGIFGTIKEKYDNWQAEHYMYCPICNAVKIRKEFRACNNCKERIVMNIQMQQQNYNRIFGDINRGYKRLEPYLSRYQILLDIMKDVYNELQYVPERVHLTPNNFEEFKEDLLENNLKVVVKDMKAMLIHRFDKTGEVSAFKAIKKLRDEILDMQIKYPQFKKYLTTDELQKIIDEGERK